jgi:ATP-dependent helicase HrpA
VREWQDIYTQLRQVVKELGLPVNSEPAEYREIHTALLTGLLSHIGMKDADKQEFTGAPAFPSSRVPVCLKSRRSGRWWPNWWKPAACGGALPPALSRNGWSRWRST